MSGRAGRRGLDKTGTVIIIADEAPEVRDFSRFRLHSTTLIHSLLRGSYRVLRICYSVNRQN